MRYDNILFDLDGTITEPVMGITNAIIYALDKYDIKVEERSTLHKFIGPPLRDSFKEFYGFDDAKAEEAVGFYREYYAKDGVLENDIMPGIKEALVTLKDGGCKLYVATSKPELYAKQILENLGLIQYFDIVAGSTMDGSRDKKELVIEYLLNQIDNLNREKTIMIGDRKFDIEGAISCNLHHMGVTFGYGSREELEKAGAMYIADNASDMCKIILGNN
ncbi:MAG: HAD hydrolase-like protein [Lachnospiraceae bacterium]|nr:HAD hydrolase-like protein [Lachnospiraceae bacterium]